MTVTEADEAASRFDGGPKSMSLFGFINRSTTVNTQGLQKPRNARKLYAIFAVTYRHKKNLSLNIYKNSVHINYTYDQNCLQI